MKSPKLRSNIKPSVPEIMERHLKRWGIPPKDTSGIAYDVDRMVVYLVIKNPIRLHLPHNLGYIQVLAHKYEGSEKQHLIDFGMTDYSVIWMKHPLLRWHSFKTRNEVNEKVLAHKKANKINYLDRYIL